MSWRAGLSPGWQTHLMFAEFDGVVAEQGNHIVVRTPHNAGYYWGNFLLYDRLATDADFGPWMRRFEEAISGVQPGTGHVAFGMHSPALSFTAPPAFVDAGFKGFGVTTLTLRAGQLRSPHKLLPPGFELRPLVLPAEAPLVVELDMACNDEGYEPEGYRRFRLAQMRRYGAMADAGMGRWWGAVHPSANGPRVVAALGVFGHNGVGRFQHVETDPDFRRRGLCRALVHAACVHAFGAMGWHTLVMGADPDDVAIGIYESVGFTRHDTLWMLERRAPEDRAAA